MERPVEQPYARAVWHLYVVRHHDRDALARGLEARGVGTLVHYPTPLHLQPAFASLGRRGGRFPGGGEGGARDPVAALVPGDDGRPGGRGGGGRPGGRPPPRVNDHIVSSGPALLAGLVLFLVPGLLFLALLPRRDRDALPLDEALFLSVAASVSLSAWVALVLAEAGVFSLVRAAVAVAAGAFAVALPWRRRLGSPFRGAGLRALLPASALLLLALLFQARPSEYVMGGRDPGTYVATMALIGRTGGIAYVDPVVTSIPPEDVELFYRHPTNPDYSWGRFMGMPLERPQTGRVVPEFFHLFPAFGAYLFQSMGVRGALATPCLFGILGTLAVFFAWRRIFGPAPAFLAAVLLAVNVVQVWFARYPMAEGMSQFLLFLGLLAFAHWEERRSAAFGALAGAAFGLALLARIDNVLLGVALAAWVLVRRARGELPWRSLVPVCAPFAALTLHAVLHAVFFSRHYFLSIANRPYWRQPVWIWGAAVLAVALVLLVAHRLEARGVAWVERHGEALRRVLVTSVVVLAVYAYFVRPHLSAWAGADGNDPARALAHRGLLVLLGFRRLAAHDAGSFLRLGWFVSPIVLALAVLGFTQLVRYWQRRYLLPLLAAGISAAFFFYKIRVYNDYFFALRRFVPVVIPALLALAAAALVRAAARGGARRLFAGAAVVVVLALYLHDTLPLLRYRDWNRERRLRGRRGAPFRARRTSSSSSSRGACTSSRCPCGRSTG